LIHALYQPEYRVRYHIRHYLEARVSAATTGSFKINSEVELTFELAFCYKVGFGTKGNERKSREMLQRSGRPAIEQESALFNIKLQGDNSRGSTGIVYRGAERRYHIELADLAHQYQNSGMLEEAESRG